MLCEGQILYHGSYAKVELIDLAKCAPGKDFGRGFYLTSDEGQAQRFIKNSLKKARALGVVPGSQNHGYVSAFRVLSTEALTVYCFEGADAEWLRYVALNRRSQLASQLESQVSERLKAADIVVGKVANDTTNTVITAYLNGLYGEVGGGAAERIAISLLLPERLKDQYCFRTEQAISHLAPTGVRRYDL